MCKHLAGKVLGTVPGTKKLLPVVLLLATHSAHEDADAWTG